MRRRAAHLLSGYSRIGAVLGALVLSIFLLLAAINGEATEDPAISPAPVQPIAAEPSAAPPAPPTTAPASPLDLPADMGPEVVLMDQLSRVEGLYGPVPFDHKGHAHMAQIQGGCVTCHHSPPDPDAEKVANIDHALSKNQAESGKHPACRTCHEVKRNDVRMPGLKGAYHQQCLNCHREWSHENACSNCHQPKDAAGKVMSREDALGKKHEPVKEPEMKVFRAKFMPADGANIAFRHKQHTERFGFACVTCHRERESCATCHGNEEDRKQRQLRKAINIDRDWNQVHQQCASCHRRQEQTCNHCHYKDDQSPPPPFEHAMTGQLLDADHANLKCVQCHGDRGARAVRGQLVKMPPTCGGASCHAQDPAIAFPTHRPGPVVPKTDANAVVKLGSTIGGGR